MGIKEAIRSRQLQIKMTFGSPTPEERGEFLAHRLMSGVNRAHRTCHGFFIAEEVTNWAIYRVAAARIARECGINQQEALNMTPNAFFEISSKRILTQGITLAIQTSTRPEDEQQQSLAKVKAELEKHAQDPKLPQAMQSVLQWFQQTGFDEAVRAAQEQRYRY